MTHKHLLLHVFLPLLATTTLFTACDQAMTPCVETDTSVVMLWASCPDHEKAELSSLVVYDDDIPMWSIANTSRDNTIDHITYGETPEDWTTVVEPLNLESGTTYTASFSYYNAPSQTDDFVAP